MMRLFLLGFILSACASGRLKYMNAGDHTASKSEPRTEINADSSLDETVTDSKVDDGSEEILIAKEKDQQLEEKPPFTDRVLEQLKQEDPETYEQVQSVYSRVTKPSLSNIYEQEEEDTTVGNILLIFALVLAILSVLFFFKAGTTSTSSADSSAEGCAIAVTNMIVFTIFGIIFGIAAIVLLIIGLIALAVVSSDRQKGQ